MELQKLVADMGFEEAFQELERILKELESPDLGIDASIDLYERGVILRAHCEARLNQAKLRIEKIIQNADGSIESAPAPELL